MNNSVNGRDRIDPRRKHLLAGALAAPAAFTLVAGAVVILDLWGILARPEAKIVAGLFVMMPFVWVVSCALRTRRRGLLDASKAQKSIQLVDTVLSTSREWLWALDNQGRFSFSSPASSDLFGYHPSELIGQHFSLVATPEDLPDTISRLVDSPTLAGHAKGLVRCQHRDGSTVWIDSSTRNRPFREGQVPGLEGTSRRVPAATAAETSVALSRSRLRKLIEGKGLITAFQPIHDLAAGHPVGAEALIRFVTDEESTPEELFAQAAAAGLTEDLEIAALETSLQAAHKLPADIYIALNVSPGTSLDSRLPEVLERSGLPLQRIVLELTEHEKVSEYDSLVSVLAPLRNRGLRIAVDDTGSGFASMRHILRLHPDVIKLDRSLIAGIDEDDGQRAFCAAMTEFARHIGATLVAEGIETEAERAAVAALGITAAQGFLLGRPTIDENEWANWHLRTWAATGRFK